MLCDDVLRMPSGSGLNKCERIVLQPCVVRSVDESDMGSIPRFNDCIHLPFDNFWLEWREGACGDRRANVHGVQFLAVQPNQPIAYVVYYRRIGSHQMPLGTMFAFDPIGVLGSSDLLVPLFSGVGPKALDLIAQWSSDERISNDCTKAARELVGLTAEEQGLQHIDHVALGRWLVMALAVINTPRVVDTSHMSRDKINKARDVKGLPPFLSWTEVKMNLDRSTAVVATQKEGLSPMPQHWVKGHWRRVRGRGMFIAAYLRGNPLYGIRKKRYAIHRVEDLDGDWVGGPLPAPKMIKEFQE
jgi:hypothetical protein